MKTYARKCDKCGKLFNEGYCINGGEQYYCSDECLFKAVPNHHRLCIGQDDSDSYWTSWEDQTEHLYFEDGTEIEV
jgi:hypothetical protein